MIFVFSWGFVMKKEFRIKKSSEIERVLDKRTSVGNSHFSLYKRENHELSHFRFAISVSKKFGGSVERNQLKRRVRDIVKEHQFLKQIEFFIIAKPAASKLTYQEIKADLEKLFARAKILEV